MTGFGRTEKIILGIAVAVLMVFSYFLYDDSLLFSKSNDNKLELIGAMSVSQNDVRRKNLDTFSWMPASSKDKIFQNDSIFTGERSQAVIQLQDGTQIKIHPNSLITLNLKNGQMNLDLRYGNLVGEIAKDSALTIKSGNEEFKLENKPGSPEKSQIQFKKAHSGTTDLKLISGNVKYTDKKKNMFKELPKDIEVSVSKNGEVKKLEKPVLTLTTADNINLLRINPNDPIPFSWDSKGEVSKFELDMSTTEDFNTVAVSKTTVDKKIAVTESLEPGDYFWRLKALDKNGDTSAVSSVNKMHIIKFEGPQITTPTAQAQVNLELKAKPKEPLNTTTDIQWTAPPYLKNFIWQVAQDSEFNSIIHQGNTKELAAVTPKLSSGTYYLRVQGQTDSQKNSPWSEVVSFTLNLVAQKEIPPSKPILITKSIDFKTPVNSDRNPSSMELPKIAWKPVSQVKNYHLQISKNIHFKEVEKYDVTQTQIGWSKYRPGKYYYRVYARGHSELISEPSETGTLDISVGAIILAPFKPIDIIALKPTPKETAATWNEVAFAKHYLVQMDRNKEFKQPLQFEFASNKGMLTLPDPGSYHIRVQALDEAHKPLTEFSNVEAALYSFKTPLSTPSLIEPFNNASIFLQTEMEPFIWLEWKKVDRATSYKIEISDQPDFSNLLISKSLRGNRYLIKDKVPLGKIYWRVRAISKPTTEISQWTDVREFTLYHQKNESFIK